MAKAKPLRRLTQEHPDLPEFFEAHREIHFGSDRAAAILVAAAVDHYLKAMIILHLENRDNTTKSNLVGQGGALSTFYNNINLAYAMGLIDETTRDDLDIIRELRNVFAHAMGHVSFATKEIEDQCSKLKTDAIYKKPLLDSDQLAPHDRQRFVAVGNEIGHKLLHKAAQKMFEDDLDSTR